MPLERKNGRNADEAVWWQRRFDGFLFFTHVLSFSFSEIKNIKLFLDTEKRQAEAARIRDKYPDRIPVRFFLMFVCSSASTTTLHQAVFRFFFFEGISALCVSSLLSDSGNRARVLDTHKSSCLSHKKGEEKEGSAQRGFPKPSATASKKTREHEKNDNDDVFFSSSSSFLALSSKKTLSFFIPVSFLTRKNPKHYTLSIPSTGHRRKGGQVGHPGHRQEKVSLMTKRAFFRCAF